MTERRSFDQHVPPFVAYGARVAQLTPASWDRLRLRCATLNGPACSALVNRALLAARPYKLPLPESTPPVGRLRAIAAVSHAVQTGIAFVGEFAFEFADSDPPASASPLRRTRSTGKPRTDAFIDATFLIESALIPLQRTEPGVVTAVRAAGRVLLMHDWLSPADFEAVYGYVESEIPFADLEAASGLDPSWVK